MKRYLILLIFPLILMGCASSPDESRATSSATSDNTTLTSHSWQLYEAKNAQGQTISSLFIHQDKPVQLDFSNGRFSVSNTCNKINGNYSLHQNQITFGAANSTRKMCADSRITALDHEIAIRLHGTGTYSLTQATQAVLTLITSNGDTLKFTGEQTPAARYGSEGEIIFLEVAPQTAPCTHALIPDKQCLQIRQVYYDSNGLKTGEPGTWQSLDQDIEGYHFQPGIRHILRVKRYKTVNVPAAPDTVYILDLVVESQIIRPHKQSGLPR